MNTTSHEAGPEEPGATPDIEVADFLDAHSNLLKAAASAESTPSTETLVALVESKRDVVTRLSPFIVSGFYRESDDKEAVDMTVGAVMEATRQLWQTATEIRPDDPTHLEFDESVRFQVVYALIHGSYEEKFDANDAKGLIANTCEAAVNNLFDKIMTSDSVIYWQMNEAATVERKRQITKFGAAATAAFIGTGLALILAQKHSR